MAADDMSPQTETPSAQQTRAPQGAPMAFAPQSQGQISPAQTRLPQNPHTAPVPTPRQDNSNWISFVGIAFALLWLSGAAAYIFGYHMDGSVQPLSPAQLGGFAMLSAGPALLFLISGLLGREVSRSSNRADQIDVALQRLGQPMEQAEGQVRTLSQSVSHEIDRLNLALESALARLAAMEEVIAHHADSLESASSAAGTRAEAMMRTLREERARLADVAEGLDDKAALIASAIKDQSTMVAAAADLADKQVKESEERLTKASARLEGVTGQINKAGDTVALSIDNRAQELKDLASTLTRHSGDLEQAYLNHCEHLSDAGEALRKEQERIAAAFDFHRAELEMMGKSAREGADTLKASAEESSQLFLTAVDDALTRAARMADRIRIESKDAAELNEKALAVLNEAAEGVREAAERSADALDYQATHARDVLSEIRETSFGALDDQMDRIKDTFSAQADAARAAIERLNETGFDAAQRSDEAFQARLREAETLTAKATAAAENASETVRRQLADTLAMARSESDKIERSLADMRERLHRAPDSARQVSEEMEAILGEGLDRMHNAALSATERAREIDDLFQARLRQNYELLSDFMLRMGAVAGGRPMMDLGVNEVPSPFSAHRASPLSDPRPDPRPEPRSEPKTEAPLELNDPISPAPTKEDDKPSRMSGTRNYIRESSRERERQAREDHKTSSFSERARTRDKDREKSTDDKKADAAKAERFTPIAPTRNERDRKGDASDIPGPTNRAQDDAQRQDPNGWRWKDLLANMEEDEKKPKK